MTLDARQGGLSIWETTDPLGFSCTILSRFENGVKKTLCSSEGENTLLIREVREERASKQVEKKAVTQITMMTWTTIFSDFPSTLLNTCNERFRLCKKQVGNLACIWYVEELVPLRSMSLSVWVDVCFLLPGNTLSSSQKKVDLQGNCSSSQVMLFGQKHCC